MHGSDLSRPLACALAVVGVVLLGGAALSSPGAANAAVATQTNDTAWNTSDSAAVTQGCPPADALRKEVYNGLEDRTVEEVRAVIPDDAVPCLPADVRRTLNLTTEPDGDSSDSGDNSTDGDDSTGSLDRCPPAEEIRTEIDDALQDYSKELVRTGIPDDEVDCLPDDVKAQLDIGTDSSGTDSGAESSGTESGTGTDTGGTGDEAAESVGCPTDAEVRTAVDAALADASPDEVLAQIPEGQRDCLPADVVEKLRGDTDSTGQSSAESGGATGTGSDGVDCPPAKEMREKVNETLQRMSAAQFRTMVPAEYVECFPPDLRERLGLQAASSGSDGDSSDSGDSAAGSAPGHSSEPMGDRDSRLFDSDGDGVVNSRDYAPNNASVKYADTDGDGVPDPYDYAPRDPDVQSEGDVGPAADPGTPDGGDGIPVVAGGALLLVLAVGGGAVVYRQYGWPGDDGDDRLPQPVGERPVASGARSEPHDVFGESAFDPEGSAGTATQFAFDAHDDAEGGFVFDNGRDDEDVITLDSDDAVSEDADAGFVFEGGPSAELDEPGEPADD